MGGRKIPGRVRGEDASIIHGTQNIEGEQTYVWYGPPDEGGLTSSSYLIWIFVKLARLINERKYLDYAEKIGNKILNFALKHEIYWKSEHDTHCIDKRAGHGALRLLICSMRVQVKKNGWMPQFGLVIGFLHGNGITMLGLVKTHR
jgi:hypothetical protein